VEERVALPALQGEHQARTELLLRGRPRRLLLAEDAQLVECARAEARLRAGGTPSQPALRHPGLVVRAGRATVRACGERGAEQRHGRYAQESGRCLFHRQSLLFGCLPWLVRSCGLSRLPWMSSEAA